MKLKHILAATIFTLAFGVCARGDGPPIILGQTQLAWDFDATAIGGLTLLEFRMYVSDTPGIVPDGTSFTAQIAAADRIWTIVGLTPGQKYAVATVLYDAGESGPSNEVAFVVPPSVLPVPTNLHVEPPPVP